MYVHKRFLARALSLLLGLLPSIAQAGPRTQLATASPASHIATSAMARPVAQAGDHWKANLRKLVQSRASTLRTAAGTTYGPNPVTIESLLAKRALNPQRFDRFHPSLGRILARAQRIRDGLACGYGTGLIYLTPYHRYLLAKRALNPNRFDFYHPVLGAILAEHIRVRDTPCTNGGGGTPGGGGGGGNPGGGGGGGEAPQIVVPEPSSLVLGAAGLAAFGIVGLRRRRHPAAARPDP